MSVPGNPNVRGTQTLCVGAGPGGPKRVRRQIADIAVAFELAPGPAFLAGLIDGDALAKQRLRCRAALHAPVAPQVDDRLGDFALHAVDEALRLDLALQMFGREVRPESD